MLPVCPRCGKEIVLASFLELQLPAQSIHRAGEISQGEVGLCDILQLHLETPLAEIAHREDAEATAGEGGQELAAHEEVAMAVYLLHRKVFRQGILHTSLQDRGIGLVEIGLRFPFRTCDSGENAREVQRDLGGV